MGIIFRNGIPYGEAGGVGKLVPEGTEYVIDNVTYTVGTNAEIFNVDTDETNKAIGNHSHAEGYNTVALGPSSHAEG